MAPLPFHGRLFQLALMYMNHALALFMVRNQDLERVDVAHVGCDRPKVNAFDDKGRCGTRKSLRMRKTQRAPDTLMRPAPVVCG
jgi:hypothetical protein